MFRINLIALLLAAGMRGQSPVPPPVGDKQSEIAGKMEAAAARQRASAQSQTTAVPEGSFFSAGWSSPSMLPPRATDCPAMEESESGPLVRAAAARHQLNPDLIKAVIRQESGFRPCAISAKGAMGLMQLMPDTADSLKTKDPLDPAQNIEAGATYLKQMLARFKGDLRLALAAYNAGPEKVDGPKPAVPDIPETREYVESISNALHGAPAELATAPAP
jgi:soluble lytic murein transglycosylase-like protein